MAVLNSLQSLKFSLPVVPQSANNDDYVGAVGDAAPLSVDTIGYNSACVLFQFGAMAADSDPVLMSVYESDDNSTYAVVTGGDWIGDTTVEPAGANEDGLMYATYIDLRKRKRYLRINFKAGAGGAALAAVLVILGDPDVSPDTVTERGVIQQLII